ncbi:MAG: carboxypeptidase-like regulatory domain-containing protein, partial [Thermoanaerobaculia bacterium]
MVIFVAGILPSSDLRADSTAALAAGQLRVQGSRLSIATEDRDRTINIGERAQVRTCYGNASVTCGITVASDPLIAGLFVKAELRGPELPEALVLDTVPGGSFFLPSFQLEGDYTLENIRLVDAFDRVIGSSEPSLVTLHVRQILLSSATVTTLSLADLKARGITLTQQNFRAFNFAVGFAFDGHTVNIEFPFLYQGNGNVDPLDKPAVDLSSLSDLTAAQIHAIERWQPPNIVPFRLDLPPVDPLHRVDEVEESIDIPLFGAIVIPGNVSFLNQFFDARLIVSNGAPIGSGAILQNVTGSMRLPHSDSGAELLRLASTTPPVGVGQKIPVVGSNNVRDLAPGVQGMASWTIEGLVSGTHTLRMDIAADLVRPGREPLPLVGVAQAAVEVVDARFNLTFSHPSVVREGEAYTLYVTVANLSRAAQNAISVNLKKADGTNNLTGTAPAPGESLSRQIETLLPGQSETLEFRLVASLTGRCVATTFQSTSSAGTGTIRLHTGVGEQGIPLSPASLVLPRFSDLLPPSFVQANIRLFGLAYSLAVAPAGLAPAGLPHVIKSDVERRAVDLGEAGQRLFLKATNLDTFEVLALDQLANRHGLEEFDALRRTLDKGRLASASLGDVLRSEQQGSNLSAIQLLDHFASTTSYARPYLATTIAAVSGAPIVPELRRYDSRGTTYLARTTDEPAPLRTLPFGEEYSILDAGSTRTALLLVGRLEDTASYQLYLHADNGAGSGHLVLIVPTEDRNGFRRVDFGAVSMAPGEVFAVKVAKAAGEAALTFQLVHAGTGIAVSGAPVAFVTAMSLPPFRLVGSMQDEVLDRYGLAVSYLFNRPPDRVSAETAASYGIRTTFHGQDTASPALTLDRALEFHGVAAFFQPNSERVVNVRYATPISPIVGTFEGRDIVSHEHRLDTVRLLDTHGSSLESAVPGVGLETNHVGGLVDGKVVRGSGELVSGAVVQLLRRRKIEGISDDEIVIDLVSEVTTGSDGLFFFPFVEEPMPQGSFVFAGYSLRAYVPAGVASNEPAETEEVSSLIRLQSRLSHVNIALLGRGRVSGRLLYDDDSSPVPQGEIRASSTLFGESLAGVVATDGSFSIAGLPVGPITVSGRDPKGNRAFQTVAIEHPGDVVTTEVRLPREATPRVGTVVGRVLMLRRGSTASELLPGARVVVYSGGALIEQRFSDSFGNFRFNRVPAGQVTLQASHFDISRTVALGDLVLSADQTASIDLTVPETATRVVVGRVLFHDPTTNT